MIIYENNSSRFSLKTFDLTSHWLFIKITVEAINPPLPHGAGLKSNLKHLLHYRYYFITLSRANKQHYRLRFIIAARVWTAAKKPNYCKLCYFCLIQDRS